MDRPPDYEALVTVPGGGQAVPLLSALEQLKEAVPFDLFRYASSRSDSAKDQRDAARDYPGRYVTLPSGPVPLLTHLRAIMLQLPAGWQATQLPHGMILYCEKQNYDYASARFLRTEAGVQFLSNGRP